MVEPHDPAPRPGTPPESHPSGLVEEIREEIEHVVESVPRPVRWTVRKLVRLIALSLLALALVIGVTAILYLSKRTQAVAKELTVFLNTTLVRRSDVAFEIADIRGNPLSDVRLIRPRVRFRDGDAPLLLEA